MWPGSRRSGGRLPGDRRGRRPSSRPRAGPGRPGAAAATSGPSGGTRCADAGKSGTHGPGRAGAEQRTCGLRCARGAVGGGPRPEQSAGSEPGARGAQRRRRGGAQPQRLQQRLRHSAVSGALRAGR
ncbi:hypothetical protein CIW49_17755 [Mycolicibacterium sp. P1-18]|nr:hypothetical protein CIW49_17755 [Mycolicibacterium sp. P1-18]